MNIVPGSFVFARRVAVVLSIIAAPVFILIYCLINPEGMNAIINDKEKFVGVIAGTVVMMIVGGGLLGTFLCSIIEGLGVWWFNHVIYPKVYQRAIDGDSEYQYVLSIYYSKCIERDGDEYTKEWLRWLMKAADQGDPDALVDLALGYSTGLVGVVDLEKALELYEKAVDNGYPIQAIQDEINRLVIAIGKKTVDI